ncbi:hypothetical protein MGSAQ_001284 [marine sediment metagenome]|uniref:Uncharacterized protein n=1 Tax=marine sediment metagenome TaxID=412755 RepID=A0A1B6NUU4_9ZZZZ
MRTAKTQQFISSAGLRRNDVIAFDGKGTALRRIGNTCHPCFDIILPSIARFA